MEREAITGGMKKGLLELGYRKEREKKEEETSLNRSRAL